MHLSVLVVDDENILVDGLIYRLKRISPEIAVQGFSNAQQAIEWVQDAVNDFDVALLDITMPGISGIDLAAELLAVNPLCDIVFVTAYSEYAIDALKIHAVDYLLKPVDDDLLYELLKKLFERKNLKSELVATAGNSLLGEFLTGAGQKQHPGQIVVSDNGKLVQLPITSIDFIYKHKREHKCRIKSNGKEYTCSQSLTEIEHLLPEHDFWRCNRSCIVNINRVVDICVDAGQRRGDIYILGYAGSMAISRQYQKKFGIYHQSLQENSIAR